MRRLTSRAAICVAAICLAACSRSPTDDPVADSESTAAAAAAPARVDGSRILNADREPGNWMTYGRTYDEQRYSAARADQCRQRREARTRLVLRPRYRCARAGIDAARDRRCDVRDLGVEQALRARRRDGPRALAIRPQGARAGGLECLLRRRQSRRRGLGGQAVPRHARRPAGRARCRERPAGVGGDDRRAGQPLHDHRRAARREGQGDHRQRRRRDGRARLCLGLRRRDRPAGLALLHRAGRPVAALREPGAREGREDLDGRVVEARRRRHGLGLDGLRPRARPALHRHRQRLAVEPRDSQPGWRRQPLPLVDRRAQGGDRRVRLALPDHARRYLGLHRRPAHDPGGSRNRRATPAR